MSVVVKTDGVALLGQNVENEKKMQSNDMKMSFLMICCFRFIGLRDKCTLYGENAQIFVVASCCVVVAFCCSVLLFVVVCTLFR